MGKIIFFVLLLLCAAAVICYYMKSEKPVLSALKGMLSGGLSLVIVHFFGGYAGFYLPLNLFTSAAALIFGIPGVMIMTLAERSDLI